LPADFAARGGIQKGGGKKIKGAWVGGRAKSREGGSKSKSVIGTECFVKETPGTKDYKRKKRSRAGKKSLVGGTWSDRGEISSREKRHVFPSGYKYQGVNWTFGAKRGELKSTGRLRGDKPRWWLLTEVPGNGQADAALTVPTYVHHFGGEKKRDGATPSIETRKESECKKRGGQGGNTIRIHRFPVVRNRKLPVKATWGLFSKKGRFQKKGL